MPAVQLEGFGGGGAGLNFKVVGGTTEPTNPKKNTIWVNTDVKITSWHFGAVEPNVYNIQPRVPDDPHCLVSPKKLSEGDIINFTIPTDVVAVFEAIRVYDPVTDKQYCVRDGGGIAAAGWPAGTKVSVRISNVLHQIGDWVGHGTAYLMAWGSYYHEEGTVWISTGTSSAVAFNALKKNGLQVYPISAKQYIDGAWVAKTAKIYQRGAWVDLWNGELYNAGDEFTNITGGWTNSGCTYASGSTSLSVIAPKKNSTYIEFTSSESSKVCGATTDKPIDLTNYSAVHFEIETLGTGTTKRCLISKSKKLNETVANVSLSATVTTKIYTIDVSNITGIHYIGALAGNSASCAFRLKKAWLE